MCHPARAVTRNQLQNRATVAKYQKRITGPLLDHYDIPIEVPSVNDEKLSRDRLGETSETSGTIRARVQAARDKQNKRFANGDSTDVVRNAVMRIGEIRQFCNLDDQNQGRMRSAMTQLNLTALGYAQDIVNVC